MKKIVIGLILAVFALLLIPMPAVALPEAETWENYTAGDDAAYEVYGNTWYGMVFNCTPESHSISAIRLLSYRAGSPSTVTVSIRETESGLPTNSDLASGTIDGDAFTNSTSGVWYTVHMDEVSLAHNETYAIVIRAEAGSVNNSIFVRYDGSSGTYVDGNEVTSSNGGITWTADTDDDMLFENVGSVLLELTGAKVFTGYLEDDDMLITALYYNTYVPHYPLEDAPTYFWVQLRSTSGNTILANYICPEWGYRPVAIYLSADQASMLTVGSTYRVYIYGNFENNPEDYYHLTAADWRGTDLSLLDMWVIGTANEMADYYNESFTTYLIGGVDEVLNTEGGVMFAIGIPDLENVRPDLFEFIPDIEEYEASTDTNVFDTATTWNAQLGTTISTALTNMGSIFGMDGQKAGMFGLLAIYIGIGIGIVALGGGFFAAGLVAVPFVVLASWLRLLDFTIIAIFAAIGVLLLIYRFWWSRT